MISIDCFPIAVIGPDGRFTRSNRPLPWRQT